MISFQQLKIKQRLLREHFPEGLGLRVHRALSWLNQAEKYQGDQDAEFIFLWIAFNAAYGCDVEEQHYSSELTTSYRFIQKLCTLDQRSLLSRILWTQYAGPIRILLNNKYVFQPYWEYKNERISQQEMQQQLTKAKRSATKALGRQDTAKVLYITLQRIYVLRNQLIHGSATCNSTVNRDQLKDCCRIMSHLVPVVIDIMMDSPRELWGSPRYTLIQEDPRLLVYEQ